ncbi:MAG: 3-phosphoshikimate 1-carboxyvinyltransferase [Clostridia bacterium]|nr:3-phosphoshikimate 1-carboxyvinyltransferase [Clostridia bacterium]
MNLRIHPGRPQGVIAAPPSKSIAHRLLLCAGLSAGESRVRGVQLSDDIRATVDCLRALGAAVRLEGDCATVRGVDPREAKSAVLPCNACGSTLRFFLPLCLLGDAPMTLTGTQTLLQRPLTVYETLCRAQGLRFERDAEQITVQGPLAPGVFEIPGNISSQFVTGLLFALPLLDGDSELRLLPPVESRPYIDLTLQALREFGIGITAQGDCFRIPGGQRFRARDCAVEGDASNAAFLEALNLIGGAVTVTGLHPASLQGDRVYESCFRQLQGGFAEIDLSDCPDLAPVLFAAAALLHGGRFTGTARLRIKESDRGAAMQQELRKFGCALEIRENEITVPPCALHAPDVPLDGHNDHRIVMALAVLACRFGGLLRGAQAVEKSYPGFFDDLKTLQIELEAEPCNGSVTAAF